MWAAEPGGAVPVPTGYQFNGSPPTPLSVGDDEKLGALFEGATRDYVMEFVRNVRLDKAEHIEPDWQPVERP